MTAAAGEAVAVCVLVNTNRTNDTNKDEGSEKSMEFASFEVEKANHKRRFGNYEGRCK